MNQVIIKPSQEQISRRGAPKVPSTQKGTRTAINAWASIQLKSFLTPEKPIEKYTEKWILEKLKETVFPDACANEKLSDQSLQNLNVSLGEFVLQYRKKSDGERVTPASMLLYLQAINR